MGNAPTGKSAAAHGRGSVPTVPDSPGRTKHAGHRDGARDDGGIVADPEQAVQFSATTSGASQMPLESNFAVTPKWHPLRRQMNEILRHCCDKNLLQI